MWYRANSCDSDSGSSNGISGKVSGSGGNTAAAAEAAAGMSGSASGKASGSDGNTAAQQLQRQRKQQRY